MAKNNIRVIVIITALIIFGMLIQKNLGLFALLPSGQYINNSDCSFLTNVISGTYENTGAWISVGGKAYGKIGKSTFISNLQGATTFPFRTPENYIVFTRSGFPDRVYIEYGSESVIFEEGQGVANQAILQCKSVTPPVYCTQDVQLCSDGSYVPRDPSNGCQFKTCPSVCVPLMSCGPWSVCSLSNQQIRTCNNGCENITTQTQSCIPVAVCKTRQEVINIGISWINGQATYAQLMEAATSWVSCA